MSAGPIARHDMIRLTPAGWRAVLAGHPHSADGPSLGGWARNGWPLVARRRSPDDPPGTVSLGLPLPPSKRRLAFAVAPDTIASVEPPPLLEILGGVPEAWRATVDALVALGRRCSVEPRAFGSFAFAHLTGLGVVTPASDLDLLWPLTPATPTLLAALPAIEAAAPGRLDGEVVDAGGRAANCRELSGGGEVLVKSLEGVALVAASAFLRGIPA